MRHFFPDNCVALASTTEATLDYHDILLGEHTHVTACAAVGGQCKTDKDCHTAKKDKCKAMLPKELAGKL